MPKHPCCPECGSQKVWKDGLVTWEIAIRFSVGCAENVVTGSATPTERRMVTVQTGLNVFTMFKDGL